MSSFGSSDKRFSMREVKLVVEKSGNGVTDVEAFRALHECDGDVVNAVLLARDFARTRAVKNLEEVFRGQCASKDEYKKGTWKSAKSVVEDEEHSAFCSTPCVYILECEDNCWYIGSTNNLKKRLKMHLDRVACAWTRKHPVLSLSEVRLVKLSGLISNKLDGRSSHHHSIYL